MQRYKYFLAFFVAIICLFGCVALAQNKTQNSPVVISAVAPIYSPSMRAINLEGDFRVDVKIDRSGKVVSSECVKGTHQLVRKVIEEASDRWQFAPDENAEKKRRVQLTFTFRLVPKASNFDSTPIFYPPYKIEVRDNRVIIDSPG
jgi:TonB family protein